MCARSNFCSLRSWHSMRRVGEPSLLRFGWRWRHSTCVICVNISSCHALFRQMDLYWSKSAWVGCSVHRHCGLLTGRRTSKGWTGNHLRSSFVTAKTTEPKRTSVTYSKLQTQRLCQQAQELYNKVLWAMLQDASIKEDVLAWIAFG